MRPSFNTTAYRFPNEYVILSLTLLLVFGVIAITATATICLSVVFVVGMVILSYGMSRSHHQELIQHAQPVTRGTVPGLVELAQANAARLQVEPVEIFIVKSPQLNAYTFGLTSPKSIVLNSALFNIMDQGEIQFIVGHEMGHVRLGHTWLNTLVGGMAGIPSSIAAAALLELAFRWWNRACEYSADRAGMLACANPQRAITALIKLEAGVSGSTPEGLQRALSAIETEDDNLANVITELLATHPMIIRRIDQLRKYAATEEYRRLQTAMEANLQ